jgi:hypothetical protein
MSPERRCPGVIFTCDLMNNFHVLKKQNSVLQAELQAEQQVWDRDSLCFEPIKHLRCLLFPIKVNYG